MLTCYLLEHDFQPKITLEIWSRHFCSSGNTSLMKIYMKEIRGTLSKRNETLFPEVCRKTDSKYGKRGNF
jgi:hypothetical protein